MSVEFSAVSLQWPAGAQHTGGSQLTLDEDLKSGFLVLCALKKEGITSI